MTIADEPLVAAVYEPTAFRPETQSAYLWTDTGEDRVRHIERWRDHAPGLRFVEIQETENEDRPAERVVCSEGGAGIEIQLRDVSAIQTFIADLGVEILYFDITGMPNAVWAPLLKAAAATGVRLRAIYAEPERYRARPSSTDTDIFDLSERIRGVAPIPGFVVMRDSGDPSDFLVPLVGFEGTRLANIVEHVQPISDNIIPIVGLPGFVPQYPFHTFRGNGSVFADRRPWLATRYALASCAFSAYYEIRRILISKPQAFLKIAPLGTRPHVLAAIASAIKYPDRTEIVYDHPRDSSNRTSGLGRIHEYDVSAMLAIPA